MYKISLQENLTVKDIFDTDVFLDESIDTFPITFDEFQVISQSGKHSFWQYKDGKIVESEFKADILKVEFNLRQKQLRQNAYQKESDPLFMKYQRGEATKEEWESKIVEITARFPYQE